MKKNFFIVFILALFLFSSCKKDRIDVVNIAGNVKNLCTDSGWANVTVHLYTSYSHSSLFNKKNSTSEISVVTSSKGDFIFNNFSIDQNSDYSYIISIDDLDNYIGGVPPGDYGHSGISGDIDKNNPANFLQLGIKGTFYSLNFYLPNGTYINSPDTLKISMAQSVFHRNMPQNVWQVNLGAGTNINYTQRNNIGNFPMGMWQLYITKIKSGVTTNIHDSIYCGLGAIANYNIPW